MPRSASLVPIILFTIAPVAAAQEVSWFDQEGTSERDEGKAVCADGTGGAIVGGRTRGVLGAASEGDYDAFLARYDANGVRLWTTQFGTGGQDGVLGLMPDGAGGAFVTGFTNGPLGGPWGGNSDLFVARYDELGDLVWVNQFGSGLSETGITLASDGAGGVFVGGDSVDTNTGERQGLLLRYDGSGIKQWDVTIPGIGFSSVRGMTEDGAGGVMLVGFGSDLIEGMEYFGPMIARYDGAGSRLWLDLFFEEHASDIGVVGIGQDLDGHFIAVGGLQLNDPVSERFDDQIYARKVTLDGDLVWSSEYGTEFLDRGHAVAPNPNGGVFIAGLTQGSFAKAVDVVDEHDMGILMAIDSSGDLTWARQFGQGDNDGEFEAIAPDGFGGAVFAGSTEEDLDGSNLGSDDVVVGRIMQDADGDGLLDDWETNGVPYLGAGGLELRLPLPGADPLRQDLFVELDSNPNVTFAPGAVARLETAFANAPNENPDGSTGITLHVQVDDGAVPVPSAWTVSPCFPPDFMAFRGAWFGTAAERGSANAAALLAAKAKAYRYGIAGEDSAPNRIGGCGQVFGDNFCIFIKGYNEEQQAAVFMHELGHNLGLRHGGGDSINGKPNYPSVMNYVMSYRSAWNSKFWTLDFSREAAGDFVTLNEGFLIESIGVGTQSGPYRNHWMPYGATQRNGDGELFRDFFFVRLNGSPTDFGSPEGDGWPNGSKLDAGAIQDLNYVASGAGVPAGIPSTPSPDQLLEPHDDWGNIFLPLAATQGAAAAAIEYPEDEPEVAVQDWIAANFDQDPPSVCEADTNGDDVLDLGDINTFVQSFLNAAPEADFNSDGVLDLGDINAFVTAFLAGC